MKKNTAKLAARMVALKIADLEKELRSAKREHARLDALSKAPKPPQIIHLVKSGDSLFGLDEVACGIKCTDGMKGAFETCQVTCGACKRTKLFAEFSVEQQ